MLYACTADTGLYSCSAFLRVPSPGCRLQLKVPGKLDRSSLHQWQLWMLMKLTFWAFAFDTLPPEKFWLLKEWEISSLERETGALWYQFNQIKKSQVWYVIVTSRLEVILHFIHSLGNKFDFRRMDLDGQKCGRICQLGERRAYSTFWWTLCWHGRLKRNLEDLLLLCWPEFYLQNPQK